MEKIKGVAYSEACIVLKSLSDLERVYELIANDENFILEFKDDNGKMAEVMIANNLSGKVKNGEIRLIAKMEE